MDLTNKKSCIIDFKLTIINNILELYKNDDFENKNFYIIFNLLNNIDSEKFKIE